MAHFNMRDLILTPADRGVFMWQLEGYKRFYNTEDHHEVSREMFNGVSIPFYHPFKDNRTFVEAFVKRIKFNRARNVT